MAVVKCSSFKLSLSAAIHEKCCTFLNVITLSSFPCCCCCCSLFFVVHGSSGGDGGDGGGGSGDWRQSSMLPSLVVGSTASRFTRMRLSSIWSVAQLNCD